MVVVRCWHGEGKEIWLSFHTIFTIGVHIIANHRKA